MKRRDLVWKRVFEGLEPVPYVDLIDLELLRKSSDGTFLDQLSQLFSPVSAYKFNKFMADAPREYAREQKEHQSKLPARDEEGFAIRIGSLISLYEFEPALKEATVALRQFDHAALVWLRSEALCRLEKYMAALKEVDKAISLEDKQYTRSKRTKNVDTESPDLDRRWVALLITRAKCLLNLERFDQAEESLEIAYSYDPNSVDVKRVSALTKNARSRTVFIGAGRAVGETVAHAAAHRLTEKAVDRIIEKRRHSRRG